MVESIAMVLPGSNIAHAQEWCHIIINVDVVRHSKSISCFQEWKSCRLDEYLRIPVK